MKRYTIINILIFGYIRG